MALARAFTALSLVCLAALASDSALIADGKLGPGWSSSLGAKSTGSVTASAEGVLLLAEPRMHALVRRANTVVGTDAEPLAVSAHIRAQAGTEGVLAPGLYVYWDRQNYLGIRGSGDGHISWFAVHRGVTVREQPLYNVMPEWPTTDNKKWREIHLRILLVSNNAAFFISTDGANWQRLGEAGRRPGDPGKAPPAIVLGRGWAGEKNGQPELCNDWYPDGSKHFIKSVLASFSLTDKPGALPPPIELPARETWEQTLSALELPGIPRSWLFLGPVSLKDAQYKKTLSPDLSDDWATPHKDPTGKAIKSSSWTNTAAMEAERAEERARRDGAGGGDNAGDADARDGYVDLGEHLGHAQQSLAWARTEIDWPVSGPALLWFGAGDPVTIYVNNKHVHADPDEHQERRAVKDRNCVPVALNKGRNVIKLRYRQNRSNWGLFLRLERNEPGYRVRILEKLLEFGTPAAGKALAPHHTLPWRMAQARHEITAQLEKMGRFSEAAQACDEAIKAFAEDDENRLKALERKLRLLEFLRDPAAMVKAGDGYLALCATGGGAGALCRTPGAASALRAVLRGEVLGGNADNARKRVRDVAAGARGTGAAAADTIVWAMRNLAAAFKDAGDDELQLMVLDELAAEEGVEPATRAQAALESALCRWACERAKNAQTPDVGRYALISRSFTKALELIPQCAEGGPPAKGKAAPPPLAALLAREAAADLKAARCERAMAGYWGAALLALAAVQPDAGAHLRLTGDYKLAVPEKGADKKPIEDLNQFRKAAWQAVLAGVGDPVWQGKWRFVGFPLQPSAPGGGAPGIRTALEPERHPERADYGEGRRWQDLDLENDPQPDVFRGNHDLGVDLRRWSGNAQVGYVTREFEVQSPGPTFLRIGASSSWFAWVDGQAAGENTNVSGFRIEADCPPLNLTAGKHRLLLKLEAPPDGPFAFRVRISREPEFALHLLVEALTARQFPQAMYDRKRQLQWLMEFAWGKTPSETPFGLATATNWLFAEHPYMRLEPVSWAMDRMRDAGHMGQYAQTLTEQLALLEASPWYADRARHIWDFSLRLFAAQVAEGRPAAADAILRDASHRYPDIEEGVCTAVALRACLRRDMGQNLSALPLYSDVQRAAPAHWRAHRAVVVWGLDWAKAFRPERLLFDTSHEVTAVLAAIRRQLEAGGPEDVERAMRNVADLLASSPGALNRVVDSPYYARYAGLREYIRALLARLPEKAREVYCRVVAPNLERRLATARTLSDAAALEVLGNEFHFTRAAESARVHAVNLYRDRGAYAQASSLLQAMLRDNQNAHGAGATANGNGHASSAVLSGKLAHTLIADRQFTAAETAIERLRKSHGAEQVAYGGETITGTRLAEKLQQRLERVKTAAARAAKTGAASGDSAAAGDSAAHLANLARTGAWNGPAPVPGPVVWAHPLIPQAALEMPRGAFALDVRSHVPSFPAVADGRVFVSGLESVRAIEVESGRILWTRTWGAGAPLLRGVFNGYPVSCPTAAGAAVYVRALESGVSAIRCHDAETGWQRWSSDTEPQLRKLVWIGEPMAAYGMVVAPYLEPGDMNTHGLAALDAESGRLRWRTNLVTGATGIKVQDNYYQATLHLGPAAADGGEIYAQTGLASVAALNAFTGEVKWMATYPRAQFGDPQNGISAAGWLGVGYDLRLCTSKTFARGPLSPIVADDLILAAPKDGSGFLALDRQTGSLRWRLDLADCRYLAGLADGNVLLCDDGGITAVQAANGRVTWEYPLLDTPLYGQPTLSGGLLYVPTEQQLLRLDARTGRPAGATPWDPRVGPLANFAVLPDGLVGVGASTIAALGKPGAKPAALPLYEARGLEAEGKLEQAAEAYRGLLQSKEMGQMLHALTARARILDKLGKRPEAVNELAGLSNLPTTLSSFNGLWRVQRDIFASALRSRLGEPAPAVEPPQGQLTGTLTYAWQLAGENCRLIEPPDGPPDRLFVCLDNELCCLRAGAQPEVLWRNYIGPGIQRIVVGPAHIAGVGEYKIVVLDRATGEAVAEALPPMSFQSRERRRTEAKKFEEAALGENVLAAATDAALYAWELPSGRALWTRKIRPFPGGLGVAGNCVLKLQPYREEKEGRVSLDAFDAPTGNPVSSLELGRRGAGMLGAFLPDRRRMLFRSERQAVCVDAGEMKKLWSAEVPKLESRGLLFDLRDGLIRYYGAENGKWQMAWLDASTGKDARPRLQGAFSFRMNNEYTVLSGDWFRTLTRQRIQGDKAETVWETALPEAAFRDHHLVGHFTAADRFHLLYVNNRAGQDHYVLRTFGWENGQVLSEQTLPGPPVFADNRFEAACAQRGNVAFYTARDGLYAYAAVPETPPAMIAKLRTELSGDAVPAERRRNARRAWVDLEPVTTMAFLAPQEMRIDGDLSEWQGIEPIALEGPLQYVPLAADEDAPAPAATEERPAASGPPRWTGRDDLAARVYLGWNRDGLAMAVDVTDDVLAAPAAPRDLTKGDNIRVVVDSRAEDGASLDRGEDFVGTLTWVNGRAIFRAETPNVEETGARPVGRVVRAPDGKGYRYELLVPWLLLRKDPAMRPGGMREMRVGVAVHDDDGAGVKGALELGAGTTTPVCVPEWLCNVTLFDISQEKIERYRKVIGMAPDTAEARSFLDLILLSRRGAQANAERAAELETFIKKHPACASTLWAVRRLRAVYRDAKEGDVAGRVQKVLQQAKAPEPLIQAAAGSSFRIWALPDAKEPPRMVMLQFSPSNDWGQPHRVYWGSLAGTQCLSWPGIRDAVCMGPMPRPGEWTELAVSPLDAGIENADLRELALTAAGGKVHFDRARVIRPGAEQVVFDDAWPAKVQTKQHGMKFVDEPRHDGAKSVTFEGGEKDGLRNTHLFMNDGKPLCSFAGMFTPPKADGDAASQQELYRKVAQLIADTPEGLNFLRRVLDLQTGDDKAKREKCVAELKTFLKANPASPNVPAILKMLHAFFGQMGEKDPRACCDELLQEYKLPRDVRRVFYSEFAPAWGEWYVIGPFAAQGERRGMDTTLGPERGVELAWKTMNASGTEVGWKKISNKLTADNKPNGDPLVDVRRHLAIPRSLETKGPNFGYAYTKFNVPSTRRALLLFGAQEIVSVWLNGKRVVSELETQPQKDKELVEVPLRSGENEVLLKIGAARDQRLAFVFRLADLDGKPFADVNNE